MNEKEAEGTENNRTGPKKQKNNNLPKYTYDLFES